MCMVPATVCKSWHCLSGAAFFLLPDKADCKTVSSLSLKSRQNAVLLWSAGLSNREDCVQAHIRISWPFCYTAMNPQKDGLPVILRPPQYISVCALCSQTTASRACSRCHFLLSEPIEMSSRDLKLSPKRLPCPQGIMGRLRVFLLPLHQLLEQSSGSGLTRFRPDYYANIGCIKEPFCILDLQPRAGGGGLQKA